MALPVFDLAGAVQRLNAQYSKQYPLNVTFNYACFDPALLAQSNATIQIVNSGHQLFAWSKAEVAFVREKNLYLKNRLVQPGIASANLLAQAIPDFQAKQQQIQAKLAKYHWQQTWHAQLLQPEVWQAWRDSTTVKNKFRLTQCHQAWQCHGTLSQFNLPALMYIGQELLPGLIKYHQWARQRLKYAYFSLPRPLYREYQRYLQEFLRAAQAQQTLLAEAMYARLAAYAQSGLTDANPTRALISALIDLKAIPANHQLALPADEFTPAQFAFFHHYIERYGDNSLKNRLKKLKWLQKNTIALEYCVTAQGGCLVPTELKNSLSAVLCWPPFLFKGAAIRAKFFQHRLLLLAAMTQKIDLPTKINLTNVAQFKTTLDSLQAKIATELATVNQQSQTLSTIFQRKTLRFIQRWQNFLLRQQHDLLEKKLALAEHFFMTMTNPSQENTLIFPWPQVAYVSEMLTELSAQIPRAETCLYQRLTQLRDSSAHIVGLNHAYHIVARLAVAANKLPTCAEITYLFNYVKNTQLYSPRLAKSFLRCCQPHFATMLNEFKATFKIGIFNCTTLAELRQYEDTLLCLNAVLMQLASEEITKARLSYLTKYGKKLFLAYLREVLRLAQQENSSKLARDRLEKIGNLLTVLGKNTVFAGKSLTAHVAELTTLTTCSGALARQACCVALVQTLEEERISHHFDQDLLVLEKNIMCFLTDKTGLAYNETGLELFNKIKQQQVNQLLPGTCLKDLPKHEQALLGEPGQLPIVVSLMKINVRAARVQQKIHSQHLGLVEKKCLIADLTKAMEKTLQKRFNAVAQHQLLSSSSGKRNVFSKSF